MLPNTTTPQQVQQQLARNRDKEVDEILGKHEGQKEGKEDGDKAQAAAGVTEMDVEGSEEDRAALQAALAMSMAESADAAVPPEPVGPGLPLDFSGNYELFGVVTHKVS